MTRSPDSRSNIRPRQRLSIGGMVYALARTSQLDCRSERGD
jgi:hypothetical protein